MRYDFNYEIVKEVCDALNWSILTNVESEYTKSLPQAALKSMWLYSESVIDWGGEADVVIDEYLDKDSDPFFRDDDEPFQLLIQEALDFENQLYLAMRVASASRVLSEWSGGGHNASDDSDAFSERNLVRIERHFASKRAELKSKIKAAI